MTPKETAIKELEKRIVTKEQAKKDFVEWIDSRLKEPFPMNVLQYWNEVKIELEKL